MLILIFATTFGTLALHQKNAHPITALRLTREALNCMGCTACLAVGLKVGELCCAEGKLPNFVRNSRI